jgi:hypothetical protein
MKKNSDDVIKLLFNEYPGAVRVKDNDGWLPLHYALRNGASDDIIRMFVDAFPESITIKDNWHDENYFQDTLLDYKAYDEMFDDAFQENQAFAIMNESWQGDGRSRTN